MDNENQLRLFSDPVASTKKSGNSEKWINKILWALSGPIIVMPGYTDMPIPENVKNRISIERLVCCMRNEEMASDVEAMWYISTASLTAPLDHHWTNIFMWLTREFVLFEGKDLPDFLQEEIVLGQYMEKDELNRLKRWLFKKSYEQIKAKMKKGKKEVQQAEEVQQTFFDWNNG